MMSKHNVARTGTAVCQQRMLSSGMTNMCFYKSCSTADPSLGTQHPCTACHRFCEGRWLRVSRGTTRPIHQGRRKEVSRKGEPSMLSRHSFRSLNRGRWLMHVLSRLWCDVSMPVPCSRCPEVQTACCRMQAVCVRSCAGPHSCSE